jgi:hypothetical protein
MPCKLIDRYGRFGDPSVLEMKALGSTETLVTVYQTTQDPSQKTAVNICRCEDLKPYNYTIVVKISYHLSYQVCSGFQICRRFLYSPLLPGITHFLQPVVCLCSFVRVSGDPS